MDLPATLELDASNLKYEGRGLHKSPLIESSVGKKESPLYIHVDSDTDWATVVPAAAGVVVALLVAWLSVGVQRNQIQGNISNFRHHWMTELRQAASELIMTLRITANGKAKKKGFNQTDRYWEYSRSAMQMHSKVSMLLSRDDAHSNAIRLEGGVLVRRVLRMQYNDPDFLSLLKEIESYQDALRSELEQAWEDAKGDLGFNRKFLLLRLFPTKLNVKQRSPFSLSDKIDWRDCR